MQNAAVENNVNTKKESEKDLDNTKPGDNGSSEVDLVVKIKPEDYAHWGLGRGVDITKDRPWVEKSSFQVRRLDADSADIIETKEGGLLKSYSEEIRSRTTVNTEVQAGIKPANTPLSVRMDVEYTRSTLSAKYVSGKKIKTRTVSFGVNFEDVPPSLAKTIAEAKADAVPREKCASKYATLERGRACKSRDDLPSDDVSQYLNGDSDDADNGPVASPLDHAFSMPNLASGALTPIPAPPLAHSVTPTPCNHRGDYGASHGVKRKTCTPPEAPSFEERLCWWLLHCLQRQTYDSHRYSVCTLQELIHLAHGDARGEELFDEIQRFLDYFVQEFKITHYVSAIELGALEYRELTWREFVHQAKVSSNTSVTAAVYGGAEASAKQKFTKTVKSHNYEMKKIGTMKEDKVREEAVIGCSLYPVTNLIKMPYLQQALRKSIDKYVKEASAGMLFYL